MQNTRASSPCFDLIKRSEDEAGFLAGRCTKLKAYKPVPSEPGWTIGWGHHGAFEGQEISAEVADALLLEDVLAVEAELRPMTVGIDLSQNEWDALVSLCYNVGTRTLPRKVPRLWRALKAGDKPAAAHEFLDINKAGKDKVELPGLTRRRRAEAELFLGHRG